MRLEVKIWNDMQNYCTCCKCEQYVGCNAKLVHNIGHFFSSFANCISLMNNMQMRTIGRMQCKTGAPHWLQALSHCNHYSLILTTVFLWFYKVYFLEWYANTIAVFLRFSKIYFSESYIFSYVEMQTIGGMQWKPGAPHWLLALSPCNHISLFL